MGIGGERTALLRKVLPGKVVPCFLETAQGTRSSPFGENFVLGSLYKGSVLW
jgi:hypothetical protein